jgi:SAM-dependent methyltransferase
MLELADIPAGARVLDLGTGTGVVAFAAAEMAGPAGKVVGVDISQEMLAQARQKAAALGLPSIDFRQGNAEHLDLPDASFDRVLSASTIFFVPDMLAAARECKRVLAPGGCLLFTCFGEDFLQPVMRMWLERVQRYGVPPRGVPSDRLADPAACENLLRVAGFDRVEVVTDRLDYTYTSGQERWEEILVSLEINDLRNLTSEQREQVRIEHIAELDAIKGETGIPCGLPVNFAFGWKAG